MHQARKRIERLGLEESFLDILRYELPQNVSERIKKYKLRSILDIGCRDGFALLLAHYKLGISHIEGVERETEHRITQDVQAFMDKVGVRPKEPSLRGFWFAVNPTDNEAHPRLPTIEDYEALMSITYGCDALQYKPLLPKYDLIVLSHVLHYMRIEEVEGMLNHIEPYIHEKTKVYISVKDMFSESPVSADDLLEACRRFAARHPSIQEYPGPIFPNDGRGYTFTNL